MSIGGAIDVNSMIVGFIAGIIGTAYFIYGKRQALLSAMLAGAALCIYPYFIDSVLWLCVVGILLMAAPFFAR
jgi:hypothetical protein